MTYTATIRRTRPLECLILPSLLLLLTMGWSRVVMGTGVVGNFIKINITVVLPEGGNRTKTIDTDENSLKTFGITREELSSALIYTNANGEVSEVVMGERHIPLHLEPVRDSSYTSYSFGTVDGGFWSVSASNFTNITIHDLEDDETLEAVEVSLDWSLPPLAQPNPADVTLTSALLEAAIYLDNTTLVRQKVSGRVAIGKWVQMVPYAGVYLQVLNPHTHLTTLAAYFNTQDYFIDRELVHTLTNLMPGRLAFLTSYYDTSGRLGASSRDTLTSLGSFAARYLTFGDCWSWAWRVGGATLAEGLVTNPHGVMSHPPPLNLEVPVSPSPPSERLCESWPLSWNKRQHFCDMYDGYGDLCSCSAPFTLPANATGTGEELGVVVVAGSRARYLFRLLRQLLTQPGVALHQVLVSIDGGYEETIKLVDLLGLRWRVHNPEGKGSPRISRHMRFALYHGVQLLATNKFIILEDDLILAPDFYSYMQQTAVLLDKDPSLFAVSAYAHFSFRHTAHDPTRLYRVHSLPAYGWMVKRSFLEETLPKWPPVFVATDWDYWMGCGLVRRGRELVIPEVSRTSHAGLSGTHFSGFVTQKRFSNKPLSDDPNTRVNLTTVNREVYEIELKELLSRAKPLNISDPYNFTFPSEPGEVYAVCVKMHFQGDDKTFKVLADALKIWSQDPRDHHYGLWRLPYHRATLLIIATPYSKYSKNYLKQQCPVLSVNGALYAHMLDNYNDENYNFLRHSPLDFLTIMNLNLDSRAQFEHHLMEHSVSHDVTSGEANNETSSHISTLLGDKTVITSTLDEDKTVYTSTPGEDKTVYTSTPAEDKTIYTSTAEDRTVYPSTPPEEKTVYTSTLAEDKTEYTR